MRYEQIKPLLDEQVLDEVKMSPSALQKFANSPEAEGMLVGIEFEMGVPNAAVDDDSGEGEYDYDMDERAYDIDSIIDFFRDGEMSNLSASGADRLRNEMWDQYLEWQSEQIQENLDPDELEERVRSRLEDDLDVNDYMDDAAEELGIDPTDNDENEDKVRERARELMGEALDEIMGDFDNRDFERAYDDIRQEMEDEMRNDGDYDQESWLRDIGVDYMSEAEREWGLDWPHWSSYGSSGDVSVDEVADDFGRAMGLESVNTSTNYHGARRDGQRWIIEPDSSIDADEGDGGLEFVSPPMPLKDGLEMIQKFYKWAKDYGCYTNKSTGLHMNISVPDMTIDKLDYVKLALFLGDEYVLKKFGREYNSYCKSAISKIKDRVRPEDVPAVLAQMKQHLNSLASKTIHSGITDKYTSINTKNNYVEFRGPGGDYLDQNPFDLINTALRLSMSLRIATDPESYKQEYAKKLYKLVEQEKDPDNSVKLFSQFAMGELPKEDLVARIKFARKEREIEKTKKAGIERLINDPAIRDKIADFPMKWSILLKSDLGNLSTSEIQSTLNNIENGEYNDELSSDQRKLAVAVLQNELEYRKETGEKQSYWVMNKDGSGGKQMVFARNENEAILTGGKNMGMSREQSIVRLRAEEKVDPLDLDSISDEEFRKQHSNLPTFTLQKFVADIRDKERSSLEKALDNVKRRNLTSNLTPENYEFLQAVIERELRRRDDEGDTGQEAPTTQDSDLPEHWQDWLTALQAQALSTLSSVQSSLAAGEYSTLNAYQSLWLRNRIEQEIQRREAASTQAQTEEWPRPWDVWVRSLELHDMANLRNVRASMTLPPNDPAARGITLSNAQRSQIVTMIDNEIVRRTEDNVQAGLAAQQNQLRRDDPVTSNDPEAESPAEVPGQGSESFEIYNPETMEIIASVQQGTMDYAVQKARQHEQDLGLSAGTLRVRSAGQTNESIDTLRRLAGIN